MRENLGLQIAVILFTVLTVTLSVSTYVYFKGYIQERDEARRTAESLHAAQMREQQLQTELQAVKRVVTEHEAADAQQIQQVHSEDVQRTGPYVPDSVRPTYQRLVGHLLTAVGAATQRETRTHANLLALREDLAERTDLHNQTVAIYLTEAEEREAEFARHRGEDDAENARLTSQSQRFANLAENQSGELADARQQFDRMQGTMTTELRKLNEQYGIVRDRWEATQVDRFEQPDGHITVADAGGRTVQLDLGSADGLQRGIVFHVYDPDAQGILAQRQKGTVEVTNVTGGHTAEGRIVRDVLSNPILSGDLVFTPLWQAGVQRQFCLLGVLDIDGDGKDDGPAIRNLLRRQSAVVEAEVDALGHPHGELTAATRYLVVGKRPLVVEKDAPPDAYERMLSRGEELGIDQISLDKLLDYLNYRPARVEQLSRQSGPLFQPRARPRVVE